MSTEAAAKEKEEEKETPKTITCNIKFPNQRAIDVARAIATLEGYKNLDEFVTDLFLQLLEGYPEGTVDIDIRWGFKSRWQICREKEEEKEKQRQKQQQRQQQQLTS